MSLTLTPQNQTPYPKPERDPPHGSQGFCLWDYDRQPIGTLAEVKLQALCSLLLLEASAAPQGPQLRSGRDSLSLAVWPELPARPPLPEQAAGLLIKDKAFAGWGCSNDSLGVAWPEAFSAFCFP